LYTGFGAFIFSFIPIILSLLTIPQIRLRNGKKNREIQYNEQNQWTSEGQWYIAQCMELAGGWFNVMKTGLTHEWDLNEKAPTNFNSVWSSICLFVGTNTIN